LFESRHLRSSQRQSIDRRECLAWLLGGTVSLAGSLASPSSSLGRSLPVNRHRDDESVSSPESPQRGETREILWEMGVSLSIGGGQARGLTATFPEPRPWLEQEILETQDQFADSVRVTTKDLEEGGRLSTVRIARLGAGESIEVVRRFRLNKWWLEPPEQTDSLRIPERVEGALRGYLQPSPFIESRDRKILDIATQLESTPGSPWERVEGIYRWVRENVRYEFDETIRSCVQALERGVGDCEEMSSLFIAICRASGVPARAVWIPGHTYPEFMLEGPDGKRHWYPCQAAGEAHDFGRMPEWRPILQKGDRFRVAGMTEPQRYLSPQLSAQEADAAPRLEWILREVMA